MAQVRAFGLMIDEYGMTWRKIDQGDTRGHSPTPYE